MTTPPKLSEINEAILASIESSIGQPIPLLPRSFLRVFSKVVAGIATTLYKYAGFTFLQMFATTATLAETEVNGKIISPLKEFGRMVGVGDPVAATRAELLVDIVVLTQVGQLQAGTTLLSATTGVVYVLLNTVSLSATTVQGNVRATRDADGGPGAGAIGNMVAGEQLQFVSPPANVSKFTVVDSQTVTGADAESEEAYRQRVLDRMQKPPQGGAFADYEQWAEETAGIVEAFPYKGDPGVVNIYCVATVVSSGSPDGVPTTAQLEAVIDSINLPYRKPISDYPVALASEMTLFDIEVQGILPDTSALRADIEDSLEAYLSQRRPYVIGLTLPPRLDTVSKAGIVGVISDVVESQGATFTDAVLNETGGTSNPIAIHVLSEGLRAKANSITYTS